MDSFDNINKLAEKFKSNFKKLKSKITGIKGLIDENDLETNNYFNNERLKNLFHEFTSFQERKMVSDEYKDMEIDVGDSGGELTLF